MQNQTSRLQQHVLEDVVDLFVNTQTRSGVALQVAQKTMVMQQFVVANLPVVVADGHQDGQIEGKQDPREQEVKDVIRFWLESPKYVSQEWHEVRCVMCGQKNPHHEHRDDGDQRERRRAREIERQYNEVQRQHSKENNRDADVSR